MLERFNSEHWPAECVGASAGGCDVPQVHAVSRAAIAAKRDMREARVLVLVCLLCVTDLNSRCAQSRRQSDAVVRGCGPMLWCGVVVRGCGAGLWCGAVVRGCGAGLWCGAGRPLGTAAIGLELLVVLWC